MPYKHKETGEYYDRGSFSNHNGKQIQTFSPWNTNLEEITITANWVVDTSRIPTKPIEVYWAESKKNDDALKRKVDEIFERVDLKPNVIVTEKPKYIPVIVKLTCPLCGSTLEWDGGALLSSPLQYRHKCPNCYYRTTTVSFYNGQELLGETEDEVYRIIKEGTREEQKELLSRKK